MYNTTAIWEACRATSAANSFFDAIAIGRDQEEFVDGALGANNPVDAVWNQAKDIWGNDQLWTNLRCLVSIGTGVPGLKPVADDVLGILKTLKDIANETEATAENFLRDKSTLYKEGRYYRFNVSQGLGNIGLAESRKRREIGAATALYIESEDVGIKMRACANGLAQRQC